LAQLSIEEIQSESRRQLAIVAPVDGTVSGILVSIGRVIKDAQSVMTIVPKHAQPQVDLYVPTKSAASLKSGMQVAIQHKAFPYEKFGVQRGTVISVSRTALPSGDLPYPITSGELYFLVAVKPLPFVHPETKKSLDLKPGMLVDGRIELETRSLLRWLIEPLDRLLKNT
jgi:membrane fusion protein